jgi:peptidoglycan/LPS O-acetylase OafA/YrhL
MDGGAMAERAEAGAPGLRNPRLDGVRGLAILLVLLFHTTQYAYVRDAGDAWLTALPALGWSGVDLFFVLSGFLITNILLQTRGSESYARTFYARRALRIFPLYYAVLAFLLLIAPRLPALASLEAAWRGNTQTDGIWYWLHLSNVEAARNRAFDHFALAIAWSLAIEEQFYLLWPWVVRRVSETRLLALCAAIAALAFALRLGLLAAGASWMVLYVLTPCRLDTLATGAAIALLARRAGGLGPLSAPARRALAASGLLLAAGVAYLRLRSRGAPPTLLGLSLVADPLMQTAGYTLLCLLWGALLVGVLTARPGSRLAKSFELAPLRSLGVYSYGLYLLHLLGIVAIARRFPPSALVQHFAAAQIAFWAAAIAASYALARLSWFALESRLLALKRHFPYRRGATPP